MFDFTTIVDRRGKDALCVDALGSGFAPGAPKEGFAPIPMWVADMCFATAPSVTKAIVERTQHPIYGYYRNSDAYYDSIIRWHASRNGVTGLEKQHIGYENGVLGGVISALNVLCSKGDKVLVHAPTYIGFTHSLGDNGYEIVHSYLKQDENQVWRMDYEDMERKLREEKIHAAILCSPHNPTGRVWERWELEKAMELFRKYDVYVISDEIWSDLLLEGRHHVPTQSVSEDARNRTVALYAPSKTFNLAGLVGSYHIIYNSWLRDRIEKESALCHYNSMNVLSMHALIGAYSDEGEAWLEELRQVLTENARLAAKFFREKVPGAKVADPEGTYMLFPDLTGWCELSGQTLDEVERACWDVGVALQDGRQFHGKCSLRLNLALPTALLQEAVDRLEKHVFHL